MITQTFEKPYPVPKTPEQELANLISVLDYTYKLTPKMKSDPLISLWREGKLTYNFIIDELDKIHNRTSDLSSNKRNAVIMLVKTAYERFEKAQSDYDSKTKSKDNE